MWATLSTLALALIFSFPSVGARAVGGIPASGSPAPLHVAHWMKVAPTGGVHPSARYAAAMADDEKDHYVVLFGGTNGSIRPFADTWSYQGGTWSKLNVSGPSARWGASMVWDRVTGYLVMFGGRNGSSAMNDTWSFVGGKWSRLAPSSSPPARYLAQATYYGNTREVVIGGGASLVANLTDLWAFRHGKWAAIPLTGSQPFHGRFSAISNDGTGNGGSPVYVGGSTGFGGNSTWTFWAGKWTLATPKSQPPATYWMALAYDSQRVAHGDVLFGELAGGGSHPGYSVTWLFNAGYNGGTWFNLSLTMRPGAREGASMTFDNYRSTQVFGFGYMLLFGGRSGTTALSDTWILN
ncbi:MAG: kelch motif-containing protein [Thermoplasmata archaeon]|nr:kelch motif-containing protein [Thermoplasmata archaeon]